MSDLLQLVRLQWRHHRLAFAGGVLMALVPALAGIALLGVSGWFITAAAVAGLTGAFLNIFLPSTVIRALAIARTAGRYGERVITHDATFRFLTNLRARIFAGQAARAGNGVKPRSGIALNRLTSDITALDAVYLRLVVPAALSLVAGGGVIAWTAAQAAVLAAGPVLLLAFVVAHVVVTLVRQKGKVARRQEAGLDAVRLRTVDLVAGRRDLAVYGGLDTASEHVLTAHERLADVEDAAEMESSAMVAWGGFAGQFCVAVTLCLSCWLVAQGTISAAVAVAAVLVVLGLPEVIGALMPGLSAFGRTRLAAGRAMAGIRAATNKNAEAAPSLSVAANAPVLRFQNVGFAYPGAGRKVLSDLSFDLGEGEWLAITGRSGCGKSTVSALASGLLKPDRGSVLLGGASVSDLPEDALRSAITVIGQRPYLFHDSIAANLRVANPRASDEQLWAALEMAALAGRVRQDPAGLETILGEGGIGLSGGEQRRLGLARAYLTQPRLFILDEFTEGLDSATAAEVLSRFQDFRGTATVLMIAHKPDEVGAADRQMRLDAAVDVLALDA